MKFSQNTENFLFRQQQKKLYSQCVDIFIFSHNIHRVKHGNCVRRISIIWFSFYCDFQFSFLALNSQTHSHIRFMHEFLALHYGNFEFSYSQYWDKFSLLHIFSLENFLSAFFLLSLNIYWNTFCFPSSTTWWKNDCF